MNNFIIYSIIASILLTAVLNILPLVFPNTATKIQKKIEENARQAIKQHEDDNLPRIKVFVPWKAMFIGSIVLTISINIVGLFAQ